MLHRNVLAIAALAFSTACQLRLDGAPCPCATGWTCCPSDNTCVAEASSCPGDDPELVVMPASIFTNGLKVEQFSASAPVTWSVDEGELGGTIDSDGLYTPPLRPGLYHVTATAGGAHASSEVIVTPLSLDLVAGGLGGSGDADGFGASARFSSPQGLAADGKGNLFVADTDNMLIRKIDLASGRVTTFAGGFLGSSNASGDGIGTAASFGRTYSVVFEGGSLFVGEQGAVRRIDAATAEVTTLAGSHSRFNNVDGVGTAAQFHTVAALVSDGAGTLYAADSQLFTIRKIAISTAQVTTLAGTPGVSGSSDGVGAAAQFSSLHSLAYEAPGILYAADGRGIRAIDVSTGAVSTLSGFTDVVSGEPVELAFSAAGIAYQVGLNGERRLYVADGSSLLAIDLTTHEVHRHSAALFNQLNLGALAASAPGVFHVLGRDAGVVLTVEVPAGSLMSVTAIAGQAGQTGIVDGAGSSARFAAPKAVTVDPQGLAYVSDREVIRVVDLTLSLVTTLVGGGDDPNGSWRSAAIEPFGLAAVGTNSVFLTQGSQYKLHRLDLGTGRVVAVGPPGCFGDALTSDAAGNVYLAGVGGACASIRKIAQGASEATTVFGTGPLKSSGLHGLVLDDVGGAYASEGCRVLRIDLATGAAVVVAGTGTAGDGLGGACDPTLADGPAGVSRLLFPAALTRDAFGRIYVADSGNGAIRRFDPRTGVLETILGTGRHGVQTGQMGLLNQPSSLAMTPSGELLIIDAAEHALLRLH